jgi:predicted small lipoprotein YifL
MARMMRKAGLGLLPLLLLPLIAGCGARGDLQMPGNPVKSRVKASSRSHVAKPEELLKPPPEARVPPAPTGEDPSTPRKDDPFDLPPA